MKISDVLSSPRKWTKGWLAVDLIGECDVHSKNAVRFCLSGAAMRAGCFEAFRQWYQKSQETRLPISFFNDAPERTFAQVRRLINMFEKHQVATRRAAKRRPLKRVSL